MICLRYFSLLPKRHSAEKPLRSAFRAGSNLESVPLFAHLVQVRLEPLGQGVQLHLLIFSLRRSTDRSQPRRGQSGWCESRQRQQQQQRRAVPPEHRLRMVFEVWGEPANWGRLPLLNVVSVCHNENLKKREVCLPANWKRVFLYHLNFVSVFYHVWRQFELAMLLIGM